MIRPCGRRLGALFLLTAFLVGGFGLSDLDALLFHSSPHGVRADVAHLEQPGGCGAHAEHCVLAVTSAQAAVAASAASIVRLSPPLAGLPSAGAVQQRQSLRGTLQYSRGPPRASAR